MPGQWAVEGRGGLTAKVQERVLLACKGLKDGDLGAIGLDQMRDVRAKERVHVPLGAPSTDAVERRVDVESISFASDFLFARTLEPPIDSQPPCPSAAATLRARQLPPPRALAAALPFTAASPARRHTGARTSLAARRRRPRPRPRLQPRRAAARGRARPTGAGAALLPPLRPLVSALCTRAWSRCWMTCAAACARWT